MERLLEGGDLPSLSRVGLRSCEPRDDYMPGPPYAPGVTAQNASRPPRTKPPLATRQLTAPPPLEQQPKVFLNPILNRLARDPDVGGPIFEVDSVDRPTARSLPRRDTPGVDSDSNNQPDRH